MALAVLFNRPMLPGGPARALFLYCSAFGPLDLSGPHASYYLFKRRNLRTHFHWINVDRSPVSSVFDI